MFSVSLGQVYSSPTSFLCPPACLEKVWASPSPPTGPCEWCGRLERNLENPISLYADQRAPHCASQQKTPPATGITERMHWGQPKAAGLLAKRLSVQFATQTGCCYRERGLLTPLSHAHVPRAHPSPLCHQQHLCSMCRQHLCCISWRTCIQMCIHVCALYTASTCTLPSLTLQYLEH